MAYKYLKDLGMEDKDIVQLWNPNDSRQEQWSKDREIYGFDERETWSLDYTFYLWLYQRLKMYNDITPVNTSFHRYKYKGKEITFQQCIDLMIKNLEIVLTKGKDSCLDLFDEKDEILDIFKLCFYQLWW